jgi:hypothetical protein
MAYRSSSRPKKKIATPRQWDAMLNHPCAESGCQKSAPFGLGPITQPAYVRWFCSLHTPADFWKFRDGVAN